ncbi:MAG: FAD:protein FMN transferase [Bacteroides sp.]|nr:FAD:protein FMN transferase [Ruminococcus flavefaciens]MCM1555093.1 FAD:protein FMN transferase [Bacteroides sp.]MCM1555456.1 FAD:protein FMN transferase [Bacteroides sp.]
MKPKILYALCLFNCLFLAACAPSEEKMEKMTGLAQGSYYAISYYTKDPRLGVEKLQPRIDSLLHAFDLCASLWNDSSEICRVNRNEDFSPSSMFCDMFGKAQQISRLTHGRFDITVGPLTRAYGFGAAKKQSLSEAERKEILSYVGWRKVRLNNGRIEKDDARLQLDFNAIAQGYCADVVAGFLNGLGITRFLADIGGEIRSQGSKTGQKPWIVGIERPAPDADAERSILSKLELENRSLVTSGNYRKYFEENGRRFSHTIDPESGISTQHNLLSATVLCQDCWEADAVATACMVMGKDSAISFQQRFADRYELFLIYAENDSLKTWHSAGFPLAE